MSSAIAIIRSLSFLESSAIVTCEIGRVTIDVTQTGNFTVYYCQPRQPEENTNFKKTELHQLIAHLGKIEEIITLNHDTDEETLVVF
jgi:RPA family protein